jgi:hypothetical protein
MLSASQRTILLVCCLVLLFVLVCPYTPSPTPIGKVKMVYFSFVILLLLPSLAHLVAEAPVIFIQAGNSHFRLIDITCARLC